jgi:hypothetical protein
MLILFNIILFSEQVFGVPEIALAKDAYLWLVSRLSNFIPMLQHALLADSHCKKLQINIIKEPFKFQTLHIIKVEN